jgi:hypothetical protein
MDIAMFDRSGPLAMGVKSMDVLNNITNGNLLKASIRVLMSSAQAMLTSF